MMTKKDARKQITDVGIIPTDWEVISLKETASDFAYGVGAEAIPFDGENKYIRITDINDVSHLFSPKPCVSPSFYDDNFFLKENDIVVARTGASVGKSYIYDASDGKLVFAGFLMKMHVCNNDSRYIFYQTTNQRYKDWVAMESQRTGQPGLNIEQLKRFRFPIPQDEGEQRRISNILYSTDRLINLLSTLIFKKQLMKDGAMQKLLSGRYRLPGYKSCWKTVELRETGKMGSGGTPSTSVAAYWNGDICWLQSGAIQNCTIYPSAVKETITELGLSKSATYVISPDSVLIAITGATCANIGYLTFASAANQSVVSLEPHEGYSARFLYQKLLTEREQILQNRGGSAQGGVSLGQLKKLELYIPSDYKEQEAIANILTTMDDEIAALEAERDKYISIKQGMMQKLLTGEIRLPICRTTE